MEYRTRKVNRREFMQRTAGTSIALSAANAAFARPLQQTQAVGRGGRKGQAYADQRTNYKDSESGRTVWKLTNVKPQGAIAMKFHAYRRSTTPDSRFLFYLSDRANPGGPNPGKPRQYDLFKMDLRTGESIQLTETGDVSATMPDATADGKLIYYAQVGTNAIRCVNTETFQEREVCRLPQRVQPGGVEDVSPDGKYLIFGRYLEPRVQYVYEFSPHARKSAILKVDSQTGRVDYLFDGLIPIEHVHVSRTDPDLVMFALHGSNWSWCQHTWLMRSDGTNVRKIFPQVNGESVGHELFSADGQTIYAGCSGGRWPQGMWATNLDGSNERCVLAGSTVAHNAVSPEQDRFVVDELGGYGDHVWMSRKGNTTPRVLAKMPANWITRTEKGVGAGGSHPDVHFLPNGQGILYTSDGEVYLVEV